MCFRVVIITDSQEYFKFGCTLVQGFTEEIISSPGKLKGKVDGNEGSALLYA